MSTNKRIARTLLRSALSLAALTMVAGTGCDEEGALGVLGVVNDLSALAADGGYGAYGGNYGGYGGSGDGDYYYGFTETDGNGGTRSFSLTPGVDAGDALETYLGGSVVYQ